MVALDSSPKIKCLTSFRFSDRAEMPRSRLSRCFRVSALRPDGGVASFDLLPA